MLVLVEEIWREDTRMRHHCLPADLRALGRTPLFRGTSDRQLSAAQQFGTIVNAAAGRVLCRQGQQPGQFVVVVSGRVITVAPSGHHRILGRGECFGALGCPRAAPRRA